MNYVMEGTTGTVVNTMDDRRFDPTSNHNNINIRSDGSVNRGFMYQSYTPDMCKRYFRNWGVFCVQHYPSKNKMTG